MADPVARQEQHADARNLSFLDRPGRGAKRSADAMDLGLGIAEDPRDPGTADDGDCGASGAAQVDPSGSGGPGRCTRARRRAMTTSPRVRSTWARAASCFGLSGTIARVVSKRISVW